MERDFGRVQATRCVSSNVAGSWSTWLAGALVVLAILIASADVVFSVQNDQARSAPLDVASWLIRGAGWLLPITFTAVGAFIVTQRPRNRIGWLMIGIGLGSGLANLMSDYPVQRYRSTRPLFSLGAWLGAWDWTLTPAFLWLLVLLFPTGQLPSRKWKPLLWLGLVGWGGATILSAVRTGHVGAAGIDNPFGVITVSESVISLLGMCGAVALPGAVLSLILRFRSAQGNIRQQLKWFTLGAVLAIISTIAAFLTGWNNTVVVLFAVTAVTSLPLFMGVAILRYHLYNIDLLINRTLVYGGLSLGVVAIYVGVVGYCTDLLHVRNTVVPSLLVTALVALAFQPARQWLQQRVNRLMFGDRDSPYQVLAQLGARFEDAFDPAEVLPTLVHTVADSLKLPYVAITIEGQERLDGRAAVGLPTGDVTSFPLVYQGERVGHLLVCPRRGETSISQPDADLLLRLAQRAGVAVHSVRLTRHLQRLSQDLQHSRERLVLAQEEERSRLRNDLHDDLAPRLAGLSLSAGTIAALVHRDPEHAATLALRLEVSIRETVGEIRRLVYDLRPPTLDDLGLLAAVQERAMQFGTNRLGSTSLVVQTELPETLPPLPAAVEVAIYRIVQEALMNVERHADARFCSIRLQVTNALQLEMRDDGIGLPKEYRPGVGLRSMRERAEELGGEFAIESAEQGGTYLHVSLPFAVVSPA